jgi:hypothetical protein
MKLVHMKLTAKMNDFMCEIDRTTFFPFMALERGQGMLFRAVSQRCTVLCKPQGQHDKEIIEIRSRQERGGNVLSTRL